MASPVALGARIGGQPPKLSVNNKPRNEATDSSEHQETYEIFFRHGQINDVPMRIERINAPGYFIRNSGTRVVVVI
jgi:hypothetical protein